jgi:hypothetical protein
MTRAIGRLFVLLLFLLLLAPAGARAQVTCGPGGNAACFQVPIYPQGGIVGSATNDTAAAGAVGEYPNINVPLGSAVPLTTGTVANVATLPLTAGNWLCAGTVAFNPAGTTTATEFDGAVSLVTAAMPTAPGAGSAFTEVGTFLAANAAQMGPTGPVVVRLAASASVFLVAKSVFAVSTNAAYGFIGCLRFR